jgi:hypothetical protein
MNKKYIDMTDEELQIAFNLAMDCGDNGVASDIYEEFKNREKK